MVPIASFKRVSTGLVVNFTNVSLGDPLTYEWDFGDSSPISTLKNPSHTYSTPGVYTVVLKATNNDGADYFVLEVMVGSVDGLNQSIQESVLCDLPHGIFIDTPCFTGLKKKWMLWLQPLVPGQINLDDVYNEQTWGDLYKILIAKLIIRDHILSLVKQSLSSISPNYNLPSSPVLEYVNDYSTTSELPDALLTAGSLVINLEVNGEIIGPHTITNTTSTKLLDYLNSLGVGFFQMDNSKVLVSIKNPNILIGINGTYASQAYEFSFIPSNPQTINTNVVSPESSAPEGLASTGSIKYIETGPSRVEWFDRSEWYANMFQKAGLLKVLEDEICSLASRVRVKLPFCKMSYKKPLFIVGKLS